MLDNAKPLAEWEGTVPKFKSLCGAETKTGTCHNPVQAAGDRCHLHKGRPLDGKRLLALMFKVIEKVAAVGGAYTAFELAYPAITHIWDPLRGLLMPEYFWDYGFQPKDRKRMAKEIEVAHEKSKELEIKYALYSIADQLAVERAYRDILRELGNGRSGT